MKMFDLVLDRWKRPHTTYQVSQFVLKKYNLDKIQMKIMNSRTRNLQYLSQRYPVPSIPKLEAN